KAQGVVFFIITDIEGALVSFKSDAVQESGCCIIRPKSTIYMSLLIYNTKTFVTENWDNLLKLN
ncbi:MAG: hypothetical protein JW976_14650, partial [Syntrophaceae bacterium]|nr:hypothetical protein [Syntrophaceae bacterium]